VGCAAHSRELLKLGINISQATVGRWMPWRPKVPSPTWRSFLRNHLPEIVAIDMFVVATATFRLLYALIVLSLDRRRVVHFEVTSNPAQYWLAGQMTEAFPWDAAPRYLLRDRDKSYGPAFRHRVRAMGITEVITAPRSPWQNLSLPKIASDDSRSAEHDRRMIAIGLLFVRMLCDYFKLRPQLEAEIVILQHQLNLLQRRAPCRPHLRRMRLADRLPDAATREAAMAAFAKSWRRG
jgi:hypothetical protein